MKKLEPIIQTTEIYICPYCGKSLGSLEAIEKHEKRFELLEKLSKCVPFRWYPVAWTRYWCGNGEKKEWVFLKQINLKSKYCCRKLESCFDLDYELRKFGEYYGWGGWLNSEKVHIFPDESLSIVEAYEKHGLIPEVDLDNTDWKHAPKCAIEHINYCIDKEHEKMLSKLRALSHEELVQKIFEQENKFQKYTGDTDESFLVESETDGLWFSQLAESVYDLKDKSIRDKPIHRLADENRKS